jgi:hypothetical protein
VEERTSVVTVSTNTNAKIVEEEAFANTVVFAEHASHVAAAPFACTAKTSLVACSATLNVLLVRTEGSSTSARNALVKAYAITVDAEQIVLTARVQAFASTEYIVMVARNVEDAACASTAVRDMPAKSAREAFIAFTKKSRVTVRFAMGVPFASMV